MAEPRTADRAPALGCGSDGVHSAVMVADVLPELYPGLVRRPATPALPFVAAGPPSSQRAVPHDLALHRSRPRRTSPKLGVTRDLDIRVVPLGADFPVTTPSVVDLPAEHRAVPARRRHPRTPQEPRAGPRRLRPPARRPPRPGSGAGGSRGVDGRRPDRPHPPPPRVRPATALVRRHRRRPVGLAVPERVPVDLSVESTRDSASR